MVDELSEKSWESVESRLYFHSCTALDSSTFCIAWRASGRREEAECIGKFCRCGSVLIFAELLWRTITMSQGYG